MKKCYKWLMLVGLIVGLYGCQTGTSQDKAPATGRPTKDQLDEVETYRAAVAQFKLVSVEEFKNLVKDGEVVYAYFGRETCEHCRRFAPELARQAALAGVEITYINTEDSEDLALKALRKTYQVEYVPSLLKLSTEGYETYQADQDPLAEFLTSSAP